METTATSATPFGSSSNTVLSAGSSRDALSSDFDTFLRMLTVQVQNQDPLNPVDATDYATQLATFSNVEQQIKTNELLEKIAGQTGGGALQSYGSWIGMEALVEAPVLFEGQTITIRPEVHKEADSAVLVVTSQSGAIVERRAIPLNDEVIQWSGLDETGAEFGHGTYSFKVESIKGDETLSSETASVYSRVDEIRSRGTEVLLHLSDGSETLATAVQGIRSPES